MKPDLGITQKNLTSVHKVLNSVLADGNILYIKLRKFHWNLSGDNFMELHLLFEDQYTAVAEAADEVAERIATLGGTAIGTTSEFAQESQLTETGTSDFLNGLMQEHEKMAWKLRKYLKP